MYLFFWRSQIDFAETEKRIKSGEEDRNDTLQVDLEMDMDLDKLSRTFNHSCNPNSGFKKANELIAIRNIKRGEEIVYDYSTTTGPNVPSTLWEMPCSCGSNNCRKIIGNVLTIPEEQINKYREAGALQDYIIKELDIIEKNNGILPKYNPIPVW